MDDKLIKTFEDNKESYLTFLKKLIECDTQVIGHGIEGGKELNGQLYLEKILKEIGADEIAKEPLSEELIQRGITNYAEGNSGHNYKDRYNLVAAFKGNSKGKSILFDGHIDTMPPGDLNLWETDPFAPTEKDGRLYGLGTSDMKSGLMAAIMAVKLIKDAGYELPGDVKIASVVDEEGGGNGTLAAVLNGHRADAAVICEPSEESLVIGHMGFVFFKVDVTGKALHSGTKWKGVNAIEKAILLIQALQELEHEWLMNYKHPFLPSPTLNIGVIEGGTAGSTVPDACTFKLCLHYLPGCMDYNSVVKDVTDAIMLRAKGDKWLKENPPHISIYQTGGAFEIDGNDSFVETAHGAMQEVLGKTNLIGATSGNDARLLRNIGKMPTVVMGPGYWQQCHSPNEYVPIDNYYDFIKIYADLILKWCSKDKQ